MKCEEMLAMLNEYVDGTVDPATLMTLGLALALAALIGLSLGLLGSGGSIVTLPVLVYIAGIPAQKAIGMSLVIVGGTSAVGSLLNMRQRAFNLRAATFFSLSGMAGAFVGAKFIVICCLKTCQTELH